MDHRSGISILLTLACVLVAATCAHGQPQPGDLGVFFDRAATQTSMTALAFMGFHLYLVATAPPGGLLGWECRLFFPGQMIVPSRALPPGRSVDLGQGDDNWIVGTGSCVATSGQAVLVDYSVLMLAATHDLTICLGPSSPSSFSPPSPGYVTCQHVDDLRPFGAAYRGCAVVNPAHLEPPVPTGQASWGSLKGHYLGQ
jgi:hypothetical protein